MRKIPISVVLITLSIFLQFYPLHSQNLWINFNSNQGPELLADAGPIDTICLGDTISLGGNPTAIGGTAPFIYSWTPQSVLDPDSSNPRFRPTMNTTFILEITDNRNCTAFDSVTIVVDSCLINSEIAGFGRLEIFPNPNSGIFSIRLDLEKKALHFSYQVTTIGGQKIMIKTIQHPDEKHLEEINLSQLSKGVYILDIDLDGSLIKRKLIIQ